MPIIDDDGRLFGVVNIIDALVVLLVLAVVIAGFALVTSQGPDQPTLTTTHATLDLGTQPEYIVSAITEGDTYSPAKHSTLTVTDVYVTPDGNRDRVTLRVKLEGIDKGDILRYDNAPPRLGRSLTIATDLYRVSGSIRAVGESDHLDRQTTSVIIQDTLGTKATAAIGPGDEIRVAGRTVATVRSVTAYPTTDPTTQNVFLNLSVKAISQRGDLRFGATPLREGQKLTLPGDGYTINGQIRRVEDPLRLESTNLLVTMTAGTETTEKIDRGDAIRAAGNRMGKVDAVTVYPTGEETRNVVVVNLSVDALTRYGDRFFGNTALREGQRVKIPMGEYVVDGEIKRIDTPLDKGTTPLLLRTTVDTVTAREIEAGDTIRAGGDTVATVESVTRYGTNNPDRTRVFIGVSAQSHQFGEREYFGRTLLREGANVPLRTPEYSITGNIERVGASHQRGTRTTKTVTLRMTDVPKPMANALSEGMAETSGSRTIAKVTDLKVRPSIVLIRGQDGDLGVYDHPIERDVTLTTELTVRETVAGTRFKGRTIQQGSTVTLDLGSTTVQATVIGIS